MGCLTAAAYLPKTGALSVMYIPAEGLSVTRVGGLTGACYASSSLLGEAVPQTRIHCRAAFICTTDLGDWLLWASDQMVLTIDGGKVYVTKTS